MANRLMKDGELHCYGAVGIIDYQGNGFTASEVLSALAEIKGPVTVRLNSGGGIANEGIAIFNALKPRAPTIYIDAMAASAASVIAMAGSAIIMRRGSMMMLHNASGLTVGTKAEHDKSSAVLDKLDGEMADIYANRSGRPVAEIRRIMDEESWFDGAEAVAERLATRAEKSSAATASAFDYSSYRHAPRELVALTQGWRASGQPLAAWSSTGRMVNASPEERYAAEFKASADLQVEFGSVEYYVAFKKAEASGRGRIFGGRTQNGLDRKAEALRGTFVTKAHVESWAAEFEASTELQSEFRTAELYCAFLNGEARRDRGRGYEGKISDVLAERGSA